MTTTAQITDWITANTGVRIDRTGFFGAQAPDLVNAYAADLYGLGHTYGHGKDMASNLAKHDGWQALTPDQTARYGDVFSTAENGHYGNCGLVVADLGADLCAFTQNADDTGADPATIRIIAKKNVTGYARPTIQD